MIHRLTKALLFILIIFVLSTFMLSGCDSSEEDEFVFKNDPVSVYYGFIKTGGGCYEATGIYILYQDITCQELSRNISNYYGSIILSHFNKPGTYKITTSTALAPEPQNEYRANASFRGDITYSAREGTIEVMPFDENDNEFQINMNLSLYPVKNANKNSNPHYYKNTITVKYCQEINTATPDLKKENCPNKE
ncbi:MAG: hypothetical protein IJM59_04720 [Proteobacteria bacterium]|nr:hypothetical protein [Pseudomonadota bacterium]